ncbi:hypothetical protein AHAS_Ahas05G0150300 [Arachis hypogaea]
MRPLRLAFRCPPQDNKKGQHNVKKQLEKKTEKKWMCLTKMRPLQLAFRTRVSTTYKKTGKKNLRSLKKMRPLRIAFRCPPRVSVI